MNKPLAAAVFALTSAIAVLVFATPARADTPSLQVAPLQYTSALSPGKVSAGFVDVSNPTDTSVHITSSVKKFRQTNSSGDLQFSDDADLSEGIKVDLSDFTLGPREAVRVAFDVDPSKLPQGGVYAAIFFRTQPSGQAQSPNTSYVVESANVGTLLILTNGGPGAHRGAITDLGLPFWQFGGGGLHGGSLSYQNTDRSKVAVAFNPRLSLSVLPWGSRTMLTTGLVMPGITRNFSFARPGSYFGLLPVTITDADSGGHRTAWVFALTSFYLWLVPLLLVLLAAFVLALRLHRIRLPRLRPARKRPARRPIRMPASQAADPAPGGSPVPLEAAPTPAEPEPVKIPVVDPATTQTIVAAEAAAPDPDTDIALKPHKVSPQVQEEKRPEPVEAPQTTRRTHKIRPAIELRPKIKPKQPKKKR